MNGSILEYMVLAKHQLGTQIRRCVTISHCWITTNLENGYWREPHFLQRNNKIQGALRTFSKDLAMRKFYSNQFTKFDSKSGGSLAHTPRKEGEISNEFRLQFRLQNVGLGLTRVESEIEDKKNRPKHSAKPMSRSKNPGEKKKNTKQDLEPYPGKKSVRWSNRKPTTTTLPQAGTPNTSGLTKTPNATPKKPKQSARREKPVVVPNNKEKEKSEKDKEKGEKEKEKDPGKPPVGGIVTTQKDASTAKPNVGATPKLPANKKTGGLAGKIKDMLF